RQQDQRQQLDHQRGYPGRVAGDAGAHRQRVTHGHGGERQVRQSAAASRRPGGGERGGEEDEVGQRVHQLGAEGASAFGGSGEGRAEQGHPADQEQRRGQQVPVHQVGAEGGEP